MIKQLVWLFLLVAFFVFYVAFYESLQDLTTTTMVIVGLTAILFGGWSAIQKYERQIKQGGAGEDEQEQCLRWSPLAELQYDLLGWSAFIVIITLALLSTSGLTVTSLAQAVVSIVTFFAGKKLFIKPR